jgi:hypothetical protein
MPYIDRGCTMPVENEMVNMNILLTLLSSFSQLQDETSITGWRDIRYQLVSLLTTLLSLGTATEKEYWADLHTCIYNHSEELATQDHSEGLFGMHVRKTKEQEEIEKWERKVNAEHRIEET